MNAWRGYVWEEGWRTRVSPQGPGILAARGVACWPLGQHAETSGQDVLKREWGGQLTPDSAG